MHGGAAPDAKANSTFETGIISHSQYCLLSCFGKGRCTRTSHMGQSGSTLQISGHASEQDFVEAISQQYSKDFAHAERIIREVERLSQPALKMGDDQNVCFQVSYGITATATPVALETERLVIKRRSGDNYATVTQYSDHDAADRGSKYLKKTARLALDQYDELFVNINSKIWSLPKLTQQGIDIYGTDVGLFVRVDDDKWANAPDGCHADADEEDEPISVTGENKLEFGACISMIEKCVKNLDESDWTIVGVIKGSNSPIGAVSAWEVGNSSVEDFIVDPTSSGGNAIQEPATAAATGEVDEATKQKWREKAGDVPMDDNFVDDDWDD